MHIHILSLCTETPIVLGRWLTLDALLDGVLEREGVPPEERILPLVAKSPDKTASNITALDARTRGLVFCASAMIPQSHVVRTADTRGNSADGEEDEGSFESDRPLVMNTVLVGGVRPQRDFEDDVFPYKTRGAQKFETVRGPGKTVMTTRPALMPGEVSWLFQGDPVAVREIADRIMWIGAKGSSGKGAVVQGSIDVISDEADDFSSLAGIVSSYGDALLRPAPADMFEQLSALPSRRSVETCWPSYWDRSHAVDALVPSSIFYDGIVNN